MKSVKLFLFLSFVLVSTTSFSQLKVDSSGRAIFGKQPFSKAISIVDETTSSMMWNLPFRITYKSNEMVTLSRGGSWGMAFSTTGSILVGYNLPTNSLSYTPLEVYGYADGGGIKVNHTSSSSHAGVSVRLGSSNTRSYTAHNGSTSVFYVTGDGIVYSRGVASITSDASLKSDITTISNPLEKLLQLRGVTFRMNLFEKREKALNTDEAYKLAKERTPELNHEIFDQIQKEKSRKQMGIIAQEVEKIIPEVVRTREDGLKSVAYSEMIGLLIEAIKEQQVLIDNLTLKMAAIDGGKLRSSSETTGLSSDLLAICKLSQNAPNPFTEQTEIKYYVADGVKDAFICVFDMQGKMLQKLDVTSGQNSLFIEGSKLDAGMYLYSLIVDGQEVDTKKMILTK